MNLKNSEEQGNPNGSMKETGKDLLQRRKQRKGVVELWCEQVDAAANGEAEAEFEDDGGAWVRGRREEEEEMSGYRKEKKRGLLSLFIRRRDETASAGMEEPKNG